MQAIVEEKRGQADDAALEEPRVWVPRDNWLALAPLVILGGISSVAYFLGFVRPYLLSTYYNHPLLDLAKINGHAPSAANEWALTWIVLFACYYLAFRLCPPAAGTTAGFRRATLLIICGWAALFCVTLIFMYPVGAADIFDQIFRARLTTHYGLNPFTTLPSGLPNDPFQPFVAWRGDASPYGPVWEILAGVASLLGGNSLWGNLVAFKALVSLAYAVSIAFTYGILRVTKPDWALRGTLFFAWNPLVLFEVAGNGHNDAIVVMFMLAAVYLLVLARRWAVIPALVAGALAKFIPLLLVPVAAACIWRDRRRTGSSEGQAGNRSLLSHATALKTLAVSAVVSIGLIVALYAPFWQGPQSIGALGRQNLFTASIPKVIVDIMVGQYGMYSGDAEGIVRTTALLLMGLLTLLLAVGIFRMGNAETQDQRSRLVGRTLAAFYEIMFAYLALAALWFQPWYLMWLVALTAPLARYTNANRTVLFCIGGVANYFVWDFVWLWNRTQVGDIQVLAVLVVYTLPLFYTLYSWLSPLWKGNYTAEGIGGEELNSYMEDSTHPEVVTVAGQGAAGSLRQSSR